jgi:hypothetical protein
MQVMCAGCRQPLEHAAARCAYCPATWPAAQSAGPTPRDVWCVSLQRYICVAWSDVGQAFVCDCGRAHEILECHGCGKAWGTALNSVGETDRSGQRRCSNCRVPRDEEAVTASACSRCGASTRQQAGREQGGAGRLHRRGRLPLECVACRAPVGWWQAGPGGSAQFRNDVDNPRTAPDASGHDHAAV